MQSQTGDQICWDPINFLCRTNRPLLTRFTPHRTGTRRYPQTGDCQKISVSSDGGDSHSFIQQAQAHVTLAGSWHHEAKLWFNPCGPNLNCQKCLYSCRHILSFFTLLSFNKSSESSVSSADWVHGDHRPHTHSIKLIFDVACIAHNAFREAINFQILLFHNPMNTWKEQLFLQWCISCTRAFTALSFCYPSIRSIAMSAWHNSVVICPSQKQVEWHARLPFSWEANSLQHSHSEAARRQANLAHIKAFTTPIISMSCWHLSVLLSSLSHKQFTEFTATSDTNNWGKRFIPERIGSAVVTNRVCDPPV